MTKNTPKAARDGTRRGGARPGAGRKKKPERPPSSLSELELRALLAEPAPEEIDGVAQRHADLAIETLTRILQFGQSESAKISAAKEILDRGYGKPAVEIGGDAAMLPFMMAPNSQAAALTRTDDIRTQARRWAAVAVAALRAIAQNGQSETARASACKALLDRGLGTVGKARMPDEQRDRPLGKKEEAARAAEAAATGRFATPPPPRAVADSTLQ